MMMGMDFCVILRLISWSVLKAICYHMGLWGDIVCFSVLSRQKWRKNFFPVLSRKKMEMVKDIIIVLISQYPMTTLKCLVIWYYDIIN